ncbi:Acetylcholine receptor subunit alpha-like [Portunus trituberculatus]|uniref:Acetylcholine receptor subunit alpha-like n=1 Tax=Portunus trituberculatus TaxID=210409 RepID=A0A5B7DIC3_PORTR|nr:Acetylcholine receptor subunit alpha-like [Portunus trituberculatus]
MRSPGCEVRQAKQASGAVAVVVSGGALDYTCRRGIRASFSHFQAPAHSPWQPCPSAGALWGGVRALECSECDVACSRGKSRDLQHLHQEDHDAGGSYEGPQESLVPGGLVVVAKFSGRSPDTEGALIPHINQTPRITTPSTYHGTNHVAGVESRMRGQARSVSADMREPVAARCAIGPGHGPLLPLVQGGHSSAPPRQAGATLKCRSRCHQSSSLGETTTMHNAGATTTTHSCLSPRLPHTAAAGTGCRGQKTSWFGRSGSGTWSHVRPIPEARPVWSWRAEDATDASRRTKKSPSAGSGVLRARPPISTSHKLLLASFLVLVGLLAPAECGNPDAKRLYDDLLSNYNKLVRPVVNVTDVLTVRIKLKLSQLIDVANDGISGEAEGEGGVSVVMAKLITLYLYLTVPHIAASTILPAVICAIPHTIACTIPLTTLSTGLPISASTVPHPIAQYM